MARARPSRNVPRGTRRIPPRPQGQPADAWVALIVGVAAFALAAYLIISATLGPDRGESSSVAALLTFSGLMFGYSFKREKS